MSDMDLSPTQMVEYLVGAGVSQTEIGRRANITQATISRIYNGKQKACWETYEAIRSVYAAELEKAGLVEFGN